MTNHTFKNTVYINYLKELLYLLLKCLTKENSIANEGS